MFTFNGVSRGRLLHQSAASMMPSDDSIKQEHFTLRYSVRLRLRRGQNR